MVTNFQFVEKNVISIKHNKEAEVYLLFALYFNLGLCWYLIQSGIPILVLVQSLSHVRLFAASWAAACQASLSFTISYSLLKLMSVELVMPSHICHPLLLLPSFFPIIRVFSNESVLRIG